MKDFVQKFAVPLAAKFHQQRTIWKALLILRWMENQPFGTISYFSVEFQCHVDHVIAVVNAKALLRPALK